MAAIVLYTSLYGHTQTYAKAIASALQCPCLDLSTSACTVTPYDTVILGSGLYASTCQSVSFLHKNEKALQNKHIFLFTCGLANPNLPENITEIRKHLSIPSTLDVSIFHFRGGISYPSLRKKHRFMMWMLCQVIKRKKHLTSENIEFLETYGQTIDFTDLSTITPLLHAISSKEAQT